MLDMLRRAKKSNKKNQNKTIQQKGSPLLKPNIPVGYNMQQRIPI